MRVIPCPFPLAAISVPLFDPIPIRVKLRRGAPDFALAASAAKHYCSSRPRFDR
tara:strand:+ start:1128 stop:1289 length:162 start_codon:yes stop_codon:yes gene_type:complete